MTQFSEELQQSVDEVIAFFDGKGPMTIHHFAVPRDLRQGAGISEHDMARILGMDLPDYQTWESDFKRLEGPVGSLLRILEAEPEAFKRVLLSGNR